MTITHGDLDRIINPFGAHSKDLPFQAKDYYDYLVEKYKDSPSSELSVLSTDLLTIDPDDEKRYWPDNFVTFVTDEYAEESPTHVIVSTFSTGIDWKRNDDDIDFYEYDYDHGTDGESDRYYAPSIKYLNRGLFPYEGNFINSRTGRTVSTRSYHETKDYIRIASEFGHNPQLLENLERLFREAEVDHAEDFQKTVRPSAPVQTVDLSEYLGIFKSIESARRLRPAIVTFWS